MAQIRQGKCPINEMQCFHSVLIKRAAILNWRLWVVEVPPIFRPEVSTLGGVSDGVVGCELGKSNFRDRTERTTNALTAGALASLLCSCGPDWLSYISNYQQGRHSAIRVWRARLHDKLAKPPNSVCLQETHQLLSSFFLSQPAARSSPGTYCSTAVCLCAAATWSNRENHSSQIERGENTPLFLSEKKYFQEWGEKTAGEQSGVINILCLCDFPTTVLPY